MLPPLVTRFIALIGHGKTMMIVNEFGGQQLYIPRTENGENWHALVEVIGERATRRLAESEYAAQEPVYIPLCHKAIRAERNRKIAARCDALLKEGCTMRGAISVISREFKPISYRQVQSIINKPLPEATEFSAQRDLF